MKTTNTYKNQIKFSLLIIATWIILVVLFCIVLNAVTSVTFAYSVSKNDYYSDYSSGSLDITDYYRDSSVTNGTVVNGLSNGTFSFTAGASVMKEDLNTLVFEFNLDNPTYENLKSGQVTQCSFQFVVYSCARDGATASEMFDIILYTQYNTSEFDFLGFRRSSYGGEKVGVVDYFQGVDSPSSALSGLGSFLGFFENMGYETLTVGNPSKTARWSGTNTKSLKIALQTSSAYTRYFVRAGMSLQYYGSTVVEDTFLDSSVVSVADVLGRMKDKDELSVLSTSIQAEANTILNEGSYEMVTVEYLKRIGETPFAEKVTAEVEVPVVDQNIKPVDVATALGISTMSVMQSACTKFNYDADKNVYTAYYYKSVWLSAKAADGNNKDYFLDCNLSFKDYYHQFVDDDIFGNDVYEWLLNGIYIDFPEILNMGIEDSNLYGYFGYVVIPETKTYNELFFKMFDGGQSHFEGTVAEFSVLSSLNVDEYNKLLDDYQYNWLETAWNDVVGFFQGGEWNAYHYIFYVDSGVTEAFIANNGAIDIDNNLGHVANTTIEAVEDIADMLSDIFLKYEDVWMVVLGFIGIFLFLFFFFYLTTKIFKLKASVNRYKASVKERDKAYALAKQDKAKSEKKLKKKYKRG